ncbi:MAG: 2,3-bisphosphoglycerate-independent phosphoglycerate mutase [bacterium]
MKPLIDSLTKLNDSKMLLVVLDGLGGLPSADHDNKTELGYADTPNMDEMARMYEIGLHIPVETGITPGSGPGHLSVFGYDPHTHIIGRGILEALGIDVEVDSGSVTARCNFATIDSNGRIQDRRAGRISTRKNQELCEKLSGSIDTIDGYAVEFHSGKEHRFVFVIRGIECSGDISDTDPQETGVKPLDAEPSGDNAAKTAAVINKAAGMIGEILKDEEKANYALFRGVSTYPDIDTMEERFKINPACIATYPMYKGLAKLVGMDILDGGSTLSDEFNALSENYEDYDYFFLHVKKTDSYGEDGDFDSKVKVIEEFDKNLPSLMKHSFDVIAITGDHSTPALMKSHSSHKVPLLLIHKYARHNNVKGFSEIECINGAIGTIYGKHIINLMLDAAGRLKKFGA